MGLVVVQHFSHQRLADAAAPMRRLDKHGLAPGGTGKVRLLPML